MIIGSRDGLTSGWNKISGPECPHLRFMGNQKKLKHHIPCIFEGKHKSVRI